MRAINVYANVESSVMTWGSIIIALFALTGLFYLSFWLDFKIGRIRFFPWSNNLGLRKKVAEVGLILGLATMVYTGVLLGAAPGRPLWGSPLIPVLFAVSGLSGGIALTVVLAAVTPRDKGTVFRSMERVHRLDRLCNNGRNRRCDRALGHCLRNFIYWCRICYCHRHGPIRIAFLGRLGYSGILDSSRSAGVCRTREKEQTSRNPNFLFWRRDFRLCAQIPHHIDRLFNADSIRKQLFRAVPISSPTLSDVLITIGLFALLAVVYFVGGMLLRSQDRNSSLCSTRPRT